MPNLVLKKEEKVILNKYGRLRLNYLKEHKKAEYTILFMEGQLNKHLKKIQETAAERVNQIIGNLKAKSDLTEDISNIIDLVLSDNMFIKNLSNNNNWTGQSTTNILETIKKYVDEL